MPKDFSRDLGYLDKFLKGLRAHAMTLAEPSRTRLSTLLDEQDQAWAEIKEHLAGVPATNVSTALGAPEPAAQDAGRNAAIPPKRLTVGSLMG